MLQFCLLSELTPAPASHTLFCKVRAHTHTCMGTCTQRHTHAHVWTHTRTDTQTHARTHAHSPVSTARASSIFVHYPFSLILPLLTSPSSFTFHSPPPFYFSSENVLLYSVPISPSKQPQAACHHLTAPAFRAERKRKK